MIIKFERRKANASAQRDRAPVARNPLNCRWIKDPATGRLRARWIPAPPASSLALAEIEEIGRIALPRAA
jgi:hypothetical protein